MTRSTNNSMATDDDDVLQPLALPHPILPSTSSTGASAARRPPSLQPAKSLPTLAPAPPPSSSASLASPPASPTAPRRGRKPSSAGQTVSRSAREAARKSNHSRIEKLRREKINDALQSLKELVPLDGDAAPEKKPSAGEKEFKLEILERTVIYLRKLKMRVRELEEGRELTSAATTTTVTSSSANHHMSSAASTTSTSTSTRPTTDVDMSEDDEQDVECDEDDPDACVVEQERERDRPAPPTRTNSSTSIRLPPIASLFPERSPHQYYLSPPSSGRSQPWQPVAPPPSLRLPPSTEEAASALIQFSTSSSPTEPAARMRRASFVGGGEYQNQTPASLLGMGHVVGADGGAPVEMRSGKKQRLM